jgi:hypothetical protein
VVKIIGRVFRGDLDDAPLLVGLACETAQREKATQIEIVLRGRDVDVVERELLIKSAGDLAQ